LGKIIALLGKKRSTVILPARHTFIAESFMFFQKKKEQPLGSKGKQPGEHGGWCSAGGSQCRRQDPDETQAARAEIKNWKRVTALIGRE